MALDFKSHIFLAFAKVPAYAEWLLDADLTSTYLYERRVLKLLQWGEPPRPWRLKSPAHVLSLDALDRAFPDARFVMTHRDPTDVMLSVCDVYADLIGVFTDHMDRAYVGRLNVEQWSTGMRRLMAFRDSGADDRFYDIDFRAMQADPIREVRGLYAWLGEPVGDAFEAGMRRGGGGGGWCVGVGDAGVVGTECAAPRAEGVGESGELWARPGGGTAEVR